MTDAPAKRSHFYYLNDALVGVSFDGPPERHEKYPVTVRDFRKLLAAHRVVNWWDIEIETTERMEKTNA